MIFFLLIIFPFLVPLVYFIDMRLVFSMADQWYWLLAIVLVLDFIYFALLYFRNKAKLKHLSVFLIYSLFFISLGFAFVLTLTDSLAINLFSVFWPLMLIIFLYSVFHYSYETTRLSLIEIKNIVPYVSVASFFVLTAILINLNIFLAVPWWIVLPIFVVSAFVFNLPFFMLYENSLKPSLLYVGAVTILISEVMVAVLYLPAGFYVLGAVVALIYYLMIILSKKKLEGILARRDYIRHFIFVAVILAIILATSQWT